LKPIARTIFAFSDGRQSCLGITAVQRERLFNEDMLACLCSTPDLLAVLRVRHGEHHCVDRGMGKHRVEVVDEL